MSKPILKVEHLVKDYGSFRAVNDISFEIPAGRVVGLLGPNGAGKTTSIQILLGLTIPTSGSICYFGKDFAIHKQYCLNKINFASAFNTLQGRLTVTENLLVFASLYEVSNPRKKIQELLKYFEISDLKDQEYYTLSTGQKTRVNFVKALLNDPKLILMDEPTASLDPDIADKTLTLIEKLKKERNLSLLYTSHNMDEVTRICDEVIFIQQGKIVAHDTPLSLTKLTPHASLKLTFNEGKDIIREYLVSQGQTHSFTNDHVVVINTEEKLIPKIIFGLSQQGIWMTDIEVKKPNLEDVFLHIARS